MKRLFSLLTLLIVGTLMVSGCSSPSATSTGDKGPITVGSKIDTEGALLSQMIILMLQNNGFQVIDKSQLGGTPVVRKALISGEIDIYPEYTGNGAFFFDGTNANIWKTAQQGYEEVKRLDLEQNNIVWLQPSPANNTWAIAMPRDLATRENIWTLDDFAAYVNRGGYVKLIGSAEFVTSEAALPAFEAAYNFHLKEEQLITLSSGNTALTEQAAAAGTDGVNAAMAYGTDGSLTALDLIVLEDPRGVQPVYAPAPIVRRAIYDQYPEIAGILNPVFQSLDLETLQTLNSRIAFEGQNATDVARAYLTSQQFLK